MCDIWTEFSWRALAGALRDTAQQQMELKSLHAELYQRKSMVCQLSHMSSSGDKMCRTRLFGAKLKRVYFNIYGNTTTSRHL